ncbi:hypothetical protein BDV26DRAFT_262963 [Aspergillus bertholletiae]|uniref:Uncharacterized protein n=1 Tax=Aspergillus bertholletiae TaxID=1226010 RepID=A0A5N7B7F2_9EURO|nr:hypothetical protein BDV26DRAFT_262963 [Aspergillus bertholletiae]
MPLPPSCYRSFHFIYTLNINISIYICIVSLQCEKMVSISSRITHLTKSSVLHLCLFISTI